MVIKALREGKILTKIDVKNAFNSIPREILFATLHRHGINEKFINYLKFFMNSRTCKSDDLSGQIDGIP